MLPQSLTYEFTFAPPFRFSAPLLIIIAQSLKDDEIFPLIFNYIKILIKISNEKTIVHDHLQWPL